MDTNKLKKEIKSLTDERQKLFKQRKELRQKLTSKTISDNSYKDEIDKINVQIKAITKKITINELLIDGEENRKKKKQRRIPLAYACFTLPDGRTIENYPLSAFKNRDLPAKKTIQSVIKKPIPVIPLDMKPEKKKKSLIDIKLQEEMSKIPIKPQIGAMGGKSLIEQELILTQQKIKNKNLINNAINYLKKLQ